MGNMEMAVQKKRIACHKERILELDLYKMNKATISDF